MNHQMAMRRTKVSVAIAVAVAIAWAVTGALSAAQSGAPEPPLTNGDITKMIAANISEPIIITAVEIAQRRNFDLSANGLVALKQAGVSDAIIAAMQKAVPAARPAAPPVTAAPSPVAPPTTAAPSPAVPAPSGFGVRPGTAAPAPRPAAAPPVSSGAESLVPAEEPQTADFRFFRIDPATGALVQLENMDVKIQNIYGSTKNYVKEENSPVVFHVGDGPMRFTTRILGPEKIEEWPKYIENERKKTYFRLEHLEIKSGKRWQTKKFVPLDVEPYGKVFFGTDTRRPKKGSLTFVYTPHEPLEPGEYALTPGGLNPCPDCGNVASGFRMVAAQ